MKLSKSLWVSNLSPIKLNGISYCTTWHAFYAFVNDERGTSYDFSHIPVRTASFLFDTVFGNLSYSEKINSMREILLSKFSAPFFRDKLLETGDEILICNDLFDDTFWGIYDNKGENHLGKLLMDLRKELQSNGNKSTGNELDPAI